MVDVSNPGHLLSSCRRGVLLSPPGHNGSGVVVIVTRAQSRCHFRSRPASVTRVRWWSGGSQHARVCADTDECQCRERGLLWPSDTAKCRRRRLQRRRFAPVVEASKRSLDVRGLQPLRHKHATNRSVLCLKGPNERASVRSSPLQAPRGDKPRSVFVLRGYSPPPNAGPGDRRDKG